MTCWILLALLVAVFALHIATMRECEKFAASDGGALLQLAASRPVYYVVAQQ